VKSYSSDQFFKGEPLPELFAGAVWEALDRLLPYLESVEGEIVGNVSTDAFLIHPELIIIGPETVVEPTAYIEGPCIIGKGCKIRHGAYIRSGALIGDGCVVGHATEIKHSILLDGAKASHFNYVGDSILGANVNLGAGVRCANFRLDGKGVRVEGNPTGRRKLGAIIGDGASVGCNAVLNPGTLLAPGTQLAPGQVL
jgi:bifunctional UDP-N-acetylglucosamine pyrophosphorylase / glucosamine-1-phosphate N-acetyltransferase